MAFPKSKAVLLIIPILVAIVMMASIYYDAYREGPLTQEALIIIPKGTSVHNTAKILSSEGVIPYASYKKGIFKAIYYIFFYGKSVQAGEYAFPASISSYDTLQKLTKGDIHYRKLTIPEGLLTIEVLKKIEESEGLVGDVPADVNEGELLPETYLYTYGESRKELVVRMYEKHIQTLETLWPGRVAGLPINNKEEVVILASIVEKETGQPEERGLVASVYLNRLARGMKLQADPTVVYAITNGKEILDRELTNKDLKINSKYNTYKYKGLPPGSICNPGTESLEAVLNPENSDFLYFVADGNGGHSFAKDITEHNRNVRLYRLQKRRDKTASPKS